jgi:hypothetical protein
MLTSHACLPPLPHVGGSPLDLAVNFLVTFPRAVVAYDVVGIRGVFLLIVALSSVFAFSACSTVLAIVADCSQGITGGSPLRAAPASPRSAWCRLEPVVVVRRAPALSSSIRIVLTD